MPRGSRALHPVRIRSLHPTEVECGPMLSWVSVASQDSELTKRPARLPGPIPSKMRSSSPEGSVVRFSFGIRRLTRWRPLSKPPRDLRDFPSGSNPQPLPRSVGVPVGCPTESEKCLTRLASWIRRSFRPRPSEEDRSFGLRRACPESVSPRRAQEGKPPEGFPLTPHCQRDAFKRVDPSGPSKAFALTHHQGVYGSRRMRQPSILSTNPYMSVC